MICPDCKNASNIRKDALGAVGLKRMFHDKCKGGTHCTCQHRIVRKNIV